MTRTLAYALNAISKKNQSDFKLASLYDSPHDLMTNYLPAASFKAFGNRRLSFILKSVSMVKKPGIIILSHINLALVGLIIKLLRPDCDIWLFAHGIEVWRPLSFLKRMLLKKCSKVICVSSYTRQQVLAWHKVKPEICHVLNNSLDPFLQQPTEFKKPQYLLERYKLSAGQPVILTLSRLASTELYKGHDSVIRAVGRLKEEFPDIKYIIAGQCDEEEELRVRELIAKEGLTDHVILSGFLDEAELPDHFLLADAFVLPSKKEGFGLVFIEALACGLPVICGDSDGSIDAIRNGALGSAINADDESELDTCIAGYLRTPLTAERRKSLQIECIAHFNTKKYMADLEIMING